MREAGGKQKNQNKKIVEENNKKIGTHFKKDMNTFGM